MHAFDWLCLFGCEPHGFVATRCSRCILGNLRYAWHRYAWCKITSPSQLIIETSDLFWFQSPVLMWTFCARSLGLGQTILRRSTGKQNCHDVLWPTTHQRSFSATRGNGKIIQADQAIVLSWYFLTRLKLNALGIRLAQLTKSLPFSHQQVNKHCHSTPLEVPQATHERPI